MFEGFSWDSVSQCAEGQGIGAVLWHVGLLSGACIFPLVFFGIQGSRPISSESNENLCTWNHLRGRMDNGAGEKTLSWFTTELLTARFLHRTRVSCSSGFFLTLSFSTYIHTLNYIHTYLMSSVHASIHSSIHPSILPSSGRPSVRPSVRASVHPCMRVCVPACIHASIHIYIYMDR